MPRPGRHPGKYALHLVAYAVMGLVTGMAVTASFLDGQWPSSVMYLALWFLAMRALNSLWERY